MKGRKFKIHMKAPFGRTMAVCGAYIYRNNNLKSAEDIKCPRRITCLKCQKNWRFRQWKYNKKVPIL